MTKTKLFFLVLLLGATVRVQAGVQAHNGYFTFTGEAGQYRRTVYWTYPGSPTYTLNQDAGFALTYDGQSFILLHFEPSYDSAAYYEIHIERLIDNFWYPEEVFPPPPGPSPTPTPEPSATPTPSPEPSPTPTPNPTPSPTPETTPTPTPNPTPTPPPWTPPPGATPLFDNVTVGPDGSVSNRPVYITPGDQPTYTFEGPNGETVNIHYHGNGGATVTTDDIRAASAQESRENAEILAELKKQTALLDEIADQGDSTQSGGESSGPTDPGVGNGGTRPGMPTNTNQAKGDEVIVKAGEVYVAGKGIVDGVRMGHWQKPMPIVVSGYGSALTVALNLPVLGAMQIDLTPWSTWINAWRDFVKFMLALVAWAVSVKIVKGAMV